jgi:hypothetical protein
MTHCTHYLHLIPSRSLLDHLDVGPFNQTDTVVKGGGNEMIQMTRDVWVILSPVGFSKSPHHERSIHLPASTHSSISPRPALPFSNSCSPFAARQTQIWTMTSEFSLLLARYLFWGTHASWMPLLVTRSFAISLSTCPQHVAVRAPGHPIVRSQLMARR